MSNQLLVELLFKLPLRSLVASAVVDVELLVDDIRGEPSTLWEAQTMQKMEFCLIGRPPFQHTCAPAVRWPSERPLLNSYLSFLNSSKVGTIILTEN
jgi:hypothetical protein